MLAGWVNASRRLSAGYLRDVVREGPVIAGWVAMWHPLEGLLYDWWPLLEERRQVDRVLEVPVEIRHPNADPPATPRLVP